MSPLGSDDGRGGGRGCVLVTGGAGFIGANLAHRLLTAGEAVTILDDLSRPGVRRNLDWLRALHGSRAELRFGSVCDASTVLECVRSAAHVFHFAAQVAVTTSLVEPLRDFDVNARGTLNVLEALRSLDGPPPLLFTSTNKVYGALGDVPLRIAGDRYEPEHPLVHARGVDEQRPLDFHSPYGCSKGAADQYVLDYARSYGLRATVFRMSCIYGPRQFGNEDQGWVAHFMIRALRKEPITIYGDGRQVRDVLFIDDLVDAMLAARDRTESTAGQAFNVGGGPDNTISLLELLDRIEELSGARPRVRLEPWRVGDQRYYVSDYGRLEAAIGWKPRVGVHDGTRRLFRWLQDELGREIPVPLSETGS